MADFAQPRDDQGPLEFPSSRHLPSSIVRLPASSFSRIPQARNKPKEPAKAPEKAPFFLPSLNSEAQGKRLGLGEEDPSAVGGDGDAKASSHRFTEFGAVMETEFSRKMSSENIDGDCEFASVSFDASPPLLAQAEFPLFSPFLLHSRILLHLPQIPFAFSNRSRTSILPHHPRPPEPLHPRSHSATQVPQGLRGRGNLHGVLPSDTWGGAGSERSRSEGAVGDYEEGAGPRGRKVGRVVWIQS